MGCGRRSACLLDLLCLEIDRQLNLYSAVQQQKAVLALAQEQMQIIELERRLVQAEAERGVFTKTCGADVSDARPSNLAVQG
jgi:hypothetical protein